MRTFLLGLLSCLCVESLLALSKTVNGIEWHYTVANGAVTITGCDRSASGALTVPATLDGKPVVAIGEGAFLGCRQLTSVTIQKGVTSLGSKAFSGCTRLTTIVLPEGVTAIREKAFYYCTSLTAVVIPSSVTLLGDWAFYGCSRLESVTLSEGMTFIGVGTFFACEALTTITIPKRVTVIGYSAFLSCTALSTVRFEGVPPRVDKDAFPSCNGYYLMAYEAAWLREEMPSGVWNNLRMAPYQWVTVTFDANGGVGGLSEQALSGSALQAPTLSRDGYRFRGWLPELSSVVPSQDTTYVAQWQKLYRFSVNCVGAGEVNQDDWFCANDCVTLTATPAAGYVFCGWSTTPVTLEATSLFTMPEEDVVLTAYFAPAIALNNYIEGYHLMTKEQAIQEALASDEVFTANEMGALALSTPMIKVKDGVATVSIQVQQASELNGEWEVVENGEVSVAIAPKPGERTAFYKFVVPNKP